MLILITVSSLCIGGVLFILALIVSQRQKHLLNPIQKQLLKRRKEAKVRASQSKQIYLKIYKVYSRIYILRTFTSRIKAGYAFVGEKEEAYLIKKAVKVTNGFILLDTVLLLFFWYVTKNLMYTGIFIFFLWYIGEGYFDFFIAKSHQRLLEQMIRFISFVRQKFYEFGVVDDAIYEGILCLSKEDREMVVQGERIYDLFTVSQRDLQMTQYFETAPNPFLKMFVNLSHMTMEYGDQRADGQSVYLINLSFLTKNIQLELDKRQRLNYALKSMNIIVLLPLFFLPLIRGWAISNFAPLGIFYNSPSGKVIEIVTILIMLFSMAMLNRIQNIDKSGYEQIKLQKWLKLIHLSLTDWQKRKWMYAFIGFLGGLILILSILEGGKGNLKTRVYYEDQFLGAKLSEQELHQRLEESKVDYRFIKNSSHKTTLVDIRYYLQSLGVKVSDSELLSDREIHIMEKMNTFNNYYLRWWHFIFCLLIGLFCYFLPDLNNYLNKKMGEMDVEDEVAGFRSIIMMLMYNQRMSVEEILEWMESFSCYYKELLHRCLLDLSCGQYEALMVMVVDAKHGQMKTIGRQLAMASEDITIKQAFDELIQEKANFFEQRKWLNEKLISRKILLGQNIGFLPAYSLIILYLIVPMIVASSQELNRFFTQISG